MNTYILYTDTTSKLVMLGTEVHSQNSSELQTYRLLRRNTSVTRKEVTGRILHKNWNAAYTNSEKASHTKPLIPSILHRMTLTVWPNHILTQFLTNHGCFRSYLYKRKQAPTPLCSCPKQAEQTARHLMTDCSLFSRERQAVFRKLLLPVIMQYHINTVELSRLIKNIYHMLQEQSKSDQSL